MKFKDTWDSMRAEQGKGLEEAIIEVIKENGLDYDAVNLGRSSDLGSSITLRTGNNEGYYIEVNQYENNVSIRTHSYENAKQLIAAMIPNFMPCNY